MESAASSAAPPSATPSIPAAATQHQYETLRELILEAKAWACRAWCGLSRGSGLSKDGETAVDVASYAAQIAAQLGAHIIKIKPPKKHLEVKEAAAAFEKAGIPIETLADRVREVIRSAFHGRRIVIFSGGEAKGTEDVLAEVREIAEGGAFGSIMGRNAFQRPRAEAIELLHAVMEIHAKTTG